MTTNNKDVIDFIKKYPDEFNELVNVFRKFQFNNDSESSEEKTLIESINVLKDQYGLNEFVKNIANLDLRKVLSILKKMIKAIEEKKKKQIIKKDNKVVSVDFDREVNQLENHAFMSKIGAFYNIGITNSDDINKDLFRMRENGNVEISI